MILRLAVLVEHRLVSDTQTRTQAHGQYRACIASRGKKTGRGTAVDVDFTLGGNVLPTFTHCRDLTVTIVCDLSFT